MWIKHAFFWLVAAFVLFLLVPLVSNTETQWKNARVELGMIEGAMGRRDAIEIANSANAAFDVLVVKSGLLALTRGGYVTEQQRRANTMPIGPGSGRVVDQTNSYLDTLAAMIYVVLLRVRMLLAWLPFVFPFLIGVVAEGYTRRKIKFAEFGEYGATVFAGAVHVGVLLSVLPVFYALAPIPISPLFVPVWILLASWPIVVAIANANQILPR